MGNGNGVGWWRRQSQAVYEDATFATRWLRRSPGFALVALLTLAIGIGGNAALFSVVDSAVLRPLPFAEPDRLTTLDLTVRAPGAAQAEALVWSYPKFAMLQAELSGYEAIAGYGTASLNLVTGDAAERIQAELVSAPYFALLGIQPIVGRTFLAAEDEAPLAAPVVMLGESLWRRQYASDPALVGREVSLSGRRFTVVGIVPATFRGLSGAAEAWTPLMMAPALRGATILTEGGAHWMYAIGRLADGVSLEEANGRLQVLGEEIDAAFRGEGQSGEWRAGARLLEERRLDPTVRRSMIVLFAAVGCVLLIACVNMASLLLVRAIGRQRELALRMALGAGAGRLIRQLLTESLLLAALGGAGGLALARAIAPLLRGMDPGRGPSGFRGLTDLSTVPMDSRIVGFTLAVTLLVGLLVGLVPALLAGRPSLAGMIKGGGQLAGRGGSRRFGTHHALVMTEAALAVLLLAGAGLMLRSFHTLQSIDPGFRAEGVLAMRYAATPADLAGRNPLGFRTRLLERLAAHPGVEMVSLGSCPPLSGPCSITVLTAINDQPVAADGGPSEIGVHHVTPDHFATLGIPLRQGRVFAPVDREGGHLVAILNEAAAKRFFPEGDAIGQRIAAGTPAFGEGISAEVIGVVADTRYGRREQPASPDLYLSGMQVASGPAPWIFLRTSGDPVLLVPGIRRAIRELDPGLPLFSIQPLETLAGGASAQARFATGLLGAFAGVALLLAALGIYGMMAYSVGQRVREIGLRMALGGTTREVMWMVLRQGGAVAGGGILLGLGLAVAATRVLQSQLHGVSATDPGVFVAIGVGFALVAATAILFPALRAARVDPQLALRAE